MMNAKQTIEKLVHDIKKGDAKLEDAWEKIQELKKVYVRQYSQQSWNSFIGKKFQEAVFSNLRNYIKQLKSQSPRFKKVHIFTESQIKKNEIISRKLAVKYGEYFLLPDADMAIVYYNFADPWSSEVLAIVSCKTSLRERIAQACYWKLKLLSSNITKNTQVVLATMDNDKDFFIIDKNNRFDGKARDRIIAEHELDGVYVLRGDFKEEWESSKVKRYQRIFNDIVQLSGTHKLPM